MGNIYDELPFAQIEYDIGENINFFISTLEEQEQLVWREYSTYKNIHNLSTKLNVDIKEAHLLLKTVISKAVQFERSLGIQD